MLANAPCALVLAALVVVQLTASVTAQCVFVDTNTDQGVVSGEVVCAVDTSVDYLVVLHSSDNAFSADDKELGAIQMSQANLTAAVTVYKLGVSSGDYLLAGFYNASSSGSSLFLSAQPIEIIDAYYDTAPLPPQTPASFSDTNGEEQIISGVLSFTAPNDTTISEFEVYLAQGAGRQAKKLLLGQIAFAGALQEHTFTLSSVQLFNDSRAYSHISVYSRTAPRLISGVDMGSVMSTNALRLRVVDRDDAVYVVTTLEKNTGTCSVGSSATCSCVESFGLCLSFNQDGISLSWRTANLAQQRYVDNTFIDVSDVLYYDIGLGPTSSELKQNCSYLNQTFDWPSGSPSSGFAASNTGEVTTFTLSGSFSELEACGFARSSDPAVFAAYGVVSLYVWTKATPAPTIPSLTIHQQISLRFKETIYDVVQAVVENIEIINPTRKGLAAEIQVSSSLSFFDTGFLSQKAAFVFGSNGDSTMNIEHKLSSNLDQFYLTLDRLWFTLTESTYADVEYELERSSSAFTNFDEPAHLGRYRLVMDVPFVMNCRPCFMHVSSKLSPTQPGTKALPLNTKQYSKSTSTSHVVVIETGQAKAKSAAATTHALSPMLAATVALVLART